MHFDNISWVPSVIGVNVHPKEIQYLSQNLIRYFTYIKFYVIIWNSVYGTYLSQSRQKSRSINTYDTAHTQGSKVKKDRSSDIDIKERTWTINPKKFAIQAYMINKLTKSRI